ncbi:MAG: glycogen synthase [Anaerolineales bacterium]|nr:glycogen synthase [Anaerolineales bacterium]
MPKTVQVLFLAAEADPFVKVGGLGDVAGSLPRALRALSDEQTGGAVLDVRLALPYHPLLKSHLDGVTSVGSYALEQSGDSAEVDIYETALDGMPVYFIDGAPIQSGGSVYSSDAALDAGKYTFFSLAALELPRYIGWKPDILHVNDWHTALAAYSALLRKWDGELKDISTVLTVHNLPFMGPDVSTLLPEYNLRLVNTGLPEWAEVMPLPLGLWAADKIVAVSPTYARELLTEENGCGLDAFLGLRPEALSGILNGIDTASFNPETDSALKANFSIETLANRFQNKEALQSQLGFTVDLGIPLLGVVSRMDQQKGIDLVLKTLKKLAGRPWQAVILGTGDPKLEKAAARLQEAAPGQFHAVLKFDSKLARQIYAGADIFLMPSRYEPCGLSQLIAMRYGCVPVVRATGGLTDTVVSGETGFLFEKPTPGGLEKILLQALAEYEDGVRWREYQLNCMKQDFSWDKSALAYFDLYRSITPLA